MDVYYVQDSKKEVLNPSVKLIEIEAPYVARKLNPASLSFSGSTKRERNSRTMQIMTGKKELLPSYSGSR